MSFLDSIDMLQLRYTELCIEKRRMLNGIDAVGKEIRSIQSEIHRLLDLFMEVGPAEEILARDEWDAGDVDELVAGVDAMLSEYGFLGDSDEEALLLEDHFDHLQKVADFEDDSQRRQLQQKRKRSRSPRRNRGGSSGAPPEYPLVVGRAVNRIIVHSLGVLPVAPSFSAIDDQSTRRQQQREFVWHPRGYEARRKYVDCIKYGSLSGPKRTTYICRIDQGGVFSVSSSDDVVLVSGPSPSAVYEMLASKFPEPLRSAFRSEFSTLESFFGLEHEATRRYLRQHSCPPI